MPKGVPKNGVNKGWFKKGIAMRTGTKNPKAKNNPQTFKKGNTPWNKGKPHLVREKNPNWKGGKSKNYHKGKKYIYWRIKVFERDNWTCQTCRARSKVGEQVYLTAHHIKGWIKYPKLRFDINNGITLCRECHYLLHKENYNEYKRK